MASEFEFRYDSDGVPIAWKFSFRKGTAEELFDKSATIHELALEDKKHRT